MTSFRSNLNSVSNTHGGLTKTQSRLTTCLKNLHQKFFKFEQRIHPKTLHEKYYKYQKNHHQQREPHVKWCQRNYKNARFFNKVNKNLRNWTNYVRKFLSKSLCFPHNFHADCNRLNWEEDELIGKLLSSTLIAPQATVPLDNIGNVTSIATIRSIAARLTNDFTIMAESFLVLREEYPDIDTEIRSILMARAQNGATIGEIKDDYRKNTGMNFPVYDRITDFLLCIPGVMAYCNERGTRIFNVKPTEKTRHIFELVMDQRAPSERNGSAGYSKSLARNDRNCDVNLNTVTPSWSTHDLISQLDHFANLHVCPINSSFPNQIQEPLQQQPYLQPLHSVDENHSRSESDGFLENRNCSYQDNCQYLYNRIYNHENNTENVNENSNSNSNINRNQHPIETHHSNMRNQVERNQSDRNIKDMNTFKLPKGRAIRSSGIRASSPSGSRSSGSAYSSETEYEAYLLDFPLLGDDFFLYLARMELKCKFKKHQKILQSGLCVSGLTIKAAINRIINLPYNAYVNRRIILNIGSVDIMQGKTLIQIEHEFRNLITILNQRGFRPIVTTLAPLANYSHNGEIKFKLERFNAFIKREAQFLLVIDIWALFVNDRKQTLFDCYQNEPRQVTGANESYVFWNKIGRQRVLRLIETNLEY